MAVLKQRVEGVEELLLSLNLAGYELNVVHEKQIGISVFFTEFKVFAGLNGIDEFISEIVALDIYDIVVGMPFSDTEPYRVKKMGFPKAGIPIDEQRVVLRRKTIGYGFGRGVGHHVGLADHESVKGEGVIDARRFIRNAGLVIFRFFGGQNLHIEITGKDLPERIADKRKKPAFNHIFLELCRTADDQRTVIRIQRPAIGKPGLYRGGGEICFQHIEHAAPQFFCRIHGIRSFPAPEKRAITKSYHNRKLPELQVNTLLN